MAIFVRPQNGKRVIDPDTRQPLPEKGAQVRDRAYWYRRKRDGDVSIGPPPKVKKAPAKVDKNEES